MLKDLTDKSLVKLNLECDDWIDAVKQAAKPLVDEGFITDNYVQGIIKNKEESGPYFVLAPNIALPHTRPEEGALKSGIGIATLKTPIRFGSKDNDPVRYMFTLSATDGDSHINALSELAELLEEESFFNMLDTAKTSKEVIEYLNKRGNKNV